MYKLSFDFKSKRVYMSQNYSFRYSGQRENMVTNLGR